jgi:hypothetical protein
MTTTALATLPPPDDQPHLRLVSSPPPPDDLLSAARAAKADSEDAERRLLRAAVDWAAAHTVDPTDPSLVASYWSEGGVPIAGAGAPEVAEFCVAEFTAALGLTARAGRALLGDAVETRHRLPRLWARVESGELPAWRARRVAQQTLDLPADGAAYVDRHVQPVAHKIGTAQLDRLVDEARVRFDPERAEELRLERSASRHLDLGLDAVRHDGTVQLDGVLDLADALDLERALRHGAAELRALGCEEPLDVRRSLAAGALARGELTLDLGAETPDQEVALTVHVSATALEGGPGELARVDGVRGFVSAEQVREWCGRPAARVVVRPVIDADQHVHVDAYEVSDRLRELTGHRDHCCVFPWCSRDARHCDRDHVVPDSDNGATCSCNLAPLCRRHHRHKTHGGWTYSVVEPGTYLWTSPRGLRYLRDHTGTREVA